MQDMQATWVWLIPGLGRSPGEGNCNPLSILPGKLPWTEEPGGLQSTGSQKSWTWLTDHTTTNGIILTYWVCKYNCILTCILDVFQISTERGGLPAFNSWVRDFPGSPVIKTLLAMQGSLVPSLVGELTSHMLCGVTGGGKTKQLKKIRKKNNWVTLAQITPPSYFNTLPSNRCLLLQPRLQWVSPPHVAGQCAVFPWDASMTSNSTGIPPLPRAPVELSLEFLGWAFARGYNQMVIRFKY